MRAANVWHLGVKELRGLQHDYGMLLFIAYSFTVAIYAAATSMPETLNKAPIAVVDEDRSPLSARMVDAFFPPHFSRPVLITHADMDRRMDRGLDTFALDIPPGFQRDLLAGRRPALQLNIDATRMMQALTGAGYVQAVVAGEVNAFLEGRRAGAPPPVGLALRLRFNPTLNRGWFGAVMEVINHIAMLSIILTGAALIREREHGTVEHLLAMPVTPLEIMATKVWSAGLVVLAAGLLSLWVIVHRVLGMPIQGSLWLFSAGAALCLFATTALGVFIGTLARSMPQFALLVILIFMPLMILSGGMTPQESMPLVIRRLMLLSPTTHFVAFSQAVLYRGAGLSVVWPRLLALAAIGGALFTLSLARFRKSLAALA